MEQIRRHQTSHARPHNGNPNALFGLGGRYHFEQIMRIIREVINMGIEGMLWAEREAADIRRDGLLEKRGRSYVPSRGAKHKQHDDTWFKTKQDASPVRGSAQRQQVPNEA